MKRILQILGMVSMALMSFLPASSYDFEVDGIYYNILSAADLTCEVTSSPDKYTGTVKVPSTVGYKSKDLTVTAIGEKAFEDCSDLIIVEIPESVTTIGPYAFHSSSIKTLDTPNSVQKIGSYAFAYCKNITYFDWPDRCTEIANNTFEGCTNLSDVKLPSMLKEIYSYAFMGCGISNIELPDFLSYIEWNAFQDCTSLSSIKIGPMVKTIYHDTFSGCSSLSSIEGGSNVEYIYKWAFLNCISLKSISLPQVRVIENEVFKNCTELMEIGIAANCNSYSDALINCPNFHKLIVYPSTKSYQNIDEEVEKTWHEWINNIDITELDLRARCFSNVKVKHSGIYYYSLEIDSLETLRLSNGQNLSWDRWNFNMQKCDRLKQIFCDEIPPTGGNFTNSQYINTIVYVPDKAYETYTQTEPWKYFWNLKRMSEYSGTHDITMTEDPSRTIINRYDLNGRVVSDNYKGIVIVVFSDGTTKKIIQN